MLCHRCYRICRASTEEMLTWSTWNRPKIEKRAKGGLRINTSKPFTCLICGNTFESKEILNDHKIKEHDFKSISSEGDL